MISDKKKKKKKYSSVLNVIYKTVFLHGETVLLQNYNRIYIYNTFVIYELSYI